MVVCPYHAGICFAFDDICMRFHTSRQSAAVSTPLINPRFYLAVTKLGSGLKAKSRRYSTSFGAMDNKKQRQNAPAAGNGGSPLDHRPSTSAGAALGTGGRVLPLLLFLQRLGRVVARRRWD